MREVNWRARSFRLKTPGLSLMQNGSKLEGQFVLILTWFGCDN